MSIEEVFIPGIDANQTMEIVRELRAHGIVQGDDFTFRYQPIKWDTGVVNILEDKGAMFYFKNPKLATFFRL